MKTFFTTIVICLLVTACSSVQTAKQSQGLGEKQKFNVSKDKAWPAMISAVNSTGGSIKEKI